MFQLDYSAIHKILDWPRAYSSEPLNYSVEDIGGISPENYQCRAFVQNLTPLGKRKVESSNLQ